MNPHSLPHIVLRVSLAFSFLYPAVAGLIAPSNWIGYFPSFLLDMFPETGLLITFELFQIVLALWILSGKKPLWANALALFVLVAIIIFNFSQMDVLFRDISLAGIALALILLAREKAPKMP